MNETRRRELLEDLLMPTPDEDAPPLTPLEQRAQEVEALARRVFSGRDLMMIMEEAGIGVGATESIIERLESSQRDGFVRDWTFSGDLVVEDVMQALAHLCAPKPGRPPSSVELPKRTRSRYFRP